MMRKTLKKDTIDTITEIIRSYVFEPIDSFYESMKKILQNYEKYGYIDGFSILTYSPINVEKEDNYIIKVNVVIKNTFYKFFITTNEELPVTRNEDFLN